MKRPPRPPDPSPRDASHQNNAAPGHAGDAHPAPPRLAVALLRRILVPAHRRAILDDLAEEHAARAVQGRRAARRAARWYWGETLRSIRPSLRHRRHLRRVPAAHRPDRRGPVDVLASELRHAARRLVRAPGFTLAAAVTLALGIGANAAIFALVHAVLLKPLPYADPDRLVWIGHTAPGVDIDEMDLSYGTWLQYRERSQTLVDIGLLQNASANLTGSGEPERLDGGVVTHTLFPLLGVRPALGRGFTADDDEPGAAPVVMLGHELWQRRFGSDADIVGSSVMINSRAREVVGVLPAGFAFPEPGIDVWFPMRVAPAEIEWGGFFNRAYARMRPGVTVQQVRDELDRLVPAAAAAYDVPPEMVANAQVAGRAQLLHERIVGDAGRSLWILLATVGVVLLIAATNIANLFLVRAEGREREVAVRRALGAGGGQITRFFLAETAFLCAVGWALGIAVAEVAVRLVVVAGADVPRLHEVGLSGPVLGMSVALAVLAGLVFGGVPLLRHGRPDLGAALKDDARAVTASGARLRGRSVLVASQVALALILLVASALMTRSVWRLVHVDLGFDPEPVLAAEIVLPDQVYASNARVADFYHQLADRLRALPGVEAAAVSSDLPLVANSRVNPLFREGIDVDEAVLPPTVSFAYVTRDYFDVMGIALARGRLFDPSEVGTAPAVVSETLAREFWPGEEALGQRARNASDGWPWARIVGVVGDVVYERVDAPPSRIIYYPIFRGDNPDLPFLPSVARVLVRTAGDPLAVAPAVRGAIRELDPNLPVASLGPLRRVVDAATARSRFTVTLLGVAAAVAVFLGSVGLYGVLSYTVAQRRREIGVRLALGARAADVRRMVLRQGMGVALVGLIVGLTASLGLARLLQSLLFEISATDPATFVAAPLLLLAVATAAVWLPARRAARVDPAEGLRAE